jgi:hypothetical protein
MSSELDQFEAVERIGSRLHPKTWAGAEMVAPTAQEHRNEILAAIERGATEDEIYDLQDRQQQGQDNRERLESTIAQIWNAIIGNCDLD